MIAPSTMYLGNYYTLYTPVQDHGRQNFDASFYEFVGINPNPSVDRFVARRVFHSFSTLEFYLDKLATGKINQPAVKQVINFHSYEVEDQAANAA